jgi:DNA replication licensing factor MCM2
LIDIARPGEEVEVTGIFVHNMPKFTKNGFPIYGTIIDANCVQKINHGAADGTITEEDKLTIRELSQRPDIFERIVASIAPSIYGHRQV